MLLGRQGDGDRVPGRAAAAVLKRMVSPVKPAWLFTIVVLLDRCIKAVKLFNC
jgi:hypothetical protein